MHPAIQLTDITRRYGTVQALDQLSLTVPSGQVLALLGPNGAGKSTATEVVLGLTKPDSGTVTVFGRSPHQAIREGSTGAMLQNGALLDTSVRRLIHGVRGFIVTRCPSTTSSSSPGSADSSTRAPQSSLGGRPNGCASR